eukprot:gene5253-6079_t
MTFSDTTDPYCVVQLDKQRHRTRTIPKKLNPFWCEEFVMEVQDPNTEKILITVIDEKKYTNDEHIGKIVIPINTLKDQRERELWFPLQTPTSSKKVPQIQVLLDFKPITLTDPSIPGSISWKDIGTPMINWSVRSKKGEMVIEEDGVSWYTALSTGVERELTESIDCITFTLWRYEPRAAASTQDTNASPNTTSRNRSTTHLGQEIKSPETSKTRSLSSSHPPMPLASSTSSLMASGSSSANDAREGWEPVFLGSGTIMAAHIDTERAADTWVCLYPKTTTENKFGDVRLKLKYSEEVVLPLESYTPLLTLLQEPNLRVVHILGNITKQREALANTLIRVFECTEHSSYLLKVLTDHEIETTDNPDIIFRGNSLATKSVDLYMKLVGLPYLSATIGPLIRKIYTSKKSCEIDPTKLDKGEDIKKNAKTLVGWVKKMTAAILASAPACPGPLREVFRAIQSKVAERYPADEITRFTAVSGFIFLRFFCPSILAPKLFELMPDHPGIKTTRSLILIAKTLQNLANLVEFGEYKEDFMKDMNRFVLDNMDNMKGFINTLSTVPADCPPAELLAPISLEKELASLYRHLIKQREDMHTEVAERNLPDHTDAMSALDEILTKLEEEVAFASIA